MPEALKALVIAIRLPKTKRTHSKKKGKDSVTIVNSAWFFKVEYEVEDSGPCRCLCAVLWGVLSRDAPARNSSHRDVLEFQS